MVFVIGKENGHLDFCHFCGQYVHVVLGSVDSDSLSEENPGRKFCPTFNLVKGIPSFNLCSLAGHLAYSSLLFVPRYRQVNGLAQPGLLPHPHGGLCHWSSPPLAGGLFTISLDVCSGNRDSHPATGVSDIYTGTILDDETEGLLYKLASPTRRRVKKNQIIIILEGK